MFRKILAALDNSSANRPVFEKALELAQQNDARLMLVHVLTFAEDGLPVPAAPLPGNYHRLGESAYEHYRKIWVVERQNATERLAALVQEAKDARVGAEYVVHDTSPERAILARAGEWGADLIVVGHRGHPILSEIFLGSVSSYVVHHARCAVLILHPDIEPHTNTSETDHRVAAP